MLHLDRTSSVLRRALSCALASATLAAAAPPLRAQSPGRAAAMAAAAFDLRNVPPGVRDSVVAVARSQIGTPYVWGAERPGRGFDCSGFTRHVLAAFGIRLPRTAAQQSQIGQEVPRQLSFLRAGDLLSFGDEKRISHIGIYIGAGRYIHASSYSGRVVEAVLDPDKPRMQRRWRGARRVIPVADTAALSAAGG